MAKYNAEMPRFCRRVNEPLLKVNQSQCKSKSIKVELIYKSYKSY